MAKVIIKQEVCKGCALCVGACPQGVLAIGDQVNSKGYYYAVLVEPIKCTGCALCAIMCPDVALEVYK